LKRALESPCNAFQKKFTKSLFSVFKNIAVKTVRGLHVNKKGLNGDFEYTE